MNGKNVVSKVLKQLCAVMLCGVLLFNSFAFTVYAADDLTSSEESSVETEQEQEEDKNEENDFISDITITSFIPLLPELAVIVAEKKDELEQITALMPTALKVTATFEEISEIIDLPVTWACVDDYETAESEEYVFYPAWDDTQYILAPEIDLSTVPTVTVKVGGQAIVDGEEEEEDEEIPELPKLTFKATDSKVEIFLNVDENSGCTFEEVEAMLKKKLGANVSILSKRQNVSTTDLRDWYIYDHYDTDMNCWNQTDANGNGVPDAWEDAYKDYPHRPYFSYTETYAQAVANPVYTIKEWVNNDSYFQDFATAYGRCKTLAKFKEHIYSYTGDNGKPAMTFAGYGSDYVSDFLFYNPESNGKKFVDFDVDSSQVKAHTLRGTGFLVNCGVADQNTLDDITDDTISGYLVYYSYIEKSTAAQEVRLYKLTDVKINDLHGPTVGSDNKPFENISGVDQPIVRVPIFEWNNNMSIQIVAEPNKIEVRQQPKASIDNIANKDPIISETFAETSLSGFGPLVDYTGFSHICPMASSFTFSNLKMGFTQGVASNDKTVLDAYQYADFTQGDGVQRYFLNYLGKSDSVYNQDGLTDEDYANYPAYLELMQKENVALITDRETPFDKSLDSNLFEDSTSTTLEDFVNSIAEYLSQKENTSWDTSLNKPTNNIPIPNPCLFDSNNNQLRDVIRVNNNTFKIKLEDKGANDGSATLTYYLMKPNGVEETITSNEIQITNNAANFPAGEYTVKLSYKDASGVISPISGYSYFTLIRPSPNDPTYSITYNANHVDAVGAVGAPTDSYAHYEGEAVSLIFTPPPTRSDYAFVGWSATPTSGTAEYMPHGPSSSMVMPGQDVTLYAVWAKQYAVIYNTMGGTLIPPAQNLQSGAKAPKPADPVRGNYSFAGWYKDEACTQAWDFDNDTIAGNLTLYAKWTEQKRDGITSYPGGTPAVRANVRLIRGNTEYGSTTADESGYYSFSNIPVGYYNAVITLGEHIVTKLVLVTNPALFEDKAAIPPILENSVVAIGANTPDIVVGKIDHLFGIQAADSYSTVDKALVLNGGKAEMRMTIEEKAKADMSLSQKQQAHEISVKTANNKKMVDSFFDFTLSKNVGSNAADFSQKHEISESFLLLPIIIPLSFELNGYSEYEVYRYHDGKVDVISATPNEKGEYLSCDGEFLSIYAKAFSMYAIAVPMKNTQPQTGSTSLPLPIMPVAAAAMTLFMAKFLLWQYEFEIGISEEERDRMVSALIDWAKGTTAIKIGIAIVCLAFVFASYNLRRFISKAIRALAKDA